LVRHFHVEEAGMKFLFGIICATLAINEGFAEISESRQENAMTGELASSKTIEMAESAKISNVEKSLEDTDIQKNSPPEFLEEKIEMNETDENIAMVHPRSGVVRNALHQHVLQSQGWRNSYYAYYNHRTMNGHAFPNLNNNYWVMMGCRHRNSNMFNVGAFIKAGQIRRRGHRFDFNSNGVRWYYWPGRSVGFAPQGQPISLNSADTYWSHHWDRISWHLHQHAGGWRCGGWTGLNGDIWRMKIVMYKHYQPPVSLRRGQSPPTGIFQNRLSPRTW